MAFQTYYIQPGDSDIRFNLPLTLEEIKRLHRFAFRQVKQDAREGAEITPHVEMLKKLDALVDYLQKEHYQNP